MIEATRASLRAAFFRLGDTAALVLLSVMAAWSMTVAHSQIGQWPLAAASGMLVGMAMQTIAAAMIGWVLGSIETMVPSMLAGMLAMIIVCLGTVAHAPGSAVHPLPAGLIAAAMTSVWLWTYQRACRGSSTSHR